MKTLITRANSRGEFDTVGMSNRWLFSDITTEAGAINRARLYSRGRAYRIELFHDHNFYNSKPFRVLEQAAFDFSPRFAANQKHKPTQKANP